MTHFWKQNLTEDGSIWRAGRCHWWLPRRLELHAEWHFFRRRNNLAAQVTLGGYSSDNELSFHVSLPWLCSLWFSAQHPIFYRRYGQERQIGFYADHRWIHWNLWVDPDAGWRTWRSRGLDFEDVIKGRYQTLEYVLDERDVLVSMPEGAYQGHGRLLKIQRRYHRWPWSKEWTVAEIDLEKPIPEPGKGENAWDMEDDATYGMSGPASSIDELIPSLIASVERQRAKYGGENWIPDKGW